MTNEMIDYKLYGKVELLLSKMELFEERLEAFENELAKVKEQCYNIHTLLEKENGDGK